MRVRIEVSEHIVSKGYITLEPEEVVTALASGLGVEAWVERNIDVDDERVVDITDFTSPANDSYDVVDREITATAGGLT